MSYFAIPPQRFMNAMRPTIGHIETDRDKGTANIQLVVSSYCDKYDLLEANIQLSE